MLEEPTKLKFMKNNKMLLLLCVSLFVSCQNNGEKNNQKETQRVEEIVTKKNPTIDDMEELEKIVKNSVVKDSANKDKKNNINDKKVELSLETLQQFKEMFSKLEKNGVLEHLSPKEKERREKAIKELERRIKEKTK
ncbi:MAG: hypothetical protein EAZ06_11645 [Cytophagales bacterium]|nr:MAG: hypothetical protein EAZ06_11645 [Cytophagales bacterium]